MTGKQQVLRLYKDMLREAAMFEVCCIYKVYQYRIKIVITRVIISVNMHNVVFVLRFVKIRI